MHLELWLQASDAAIDEKTSTFAGECFVPWKHCLEEANRGEWIRTQVFLSDVSGRGKGTVTAAQINLYVRYIEKGAPDSSFNVDGSVKVKKPVHSVAMVEQTKHDYRAANTAGAAGVLLCSPLEFTPITGLDPAEKYAVRFLFETSKCEATSTEGKIKNGKFEWYDVRRMTVNDTRVDKDLAVFFVRLTPIGTPDEVVASGKFAASVLETVYSDPKGSAAKPFTLPLATKAG